MALVCKITPRGLMNGTALALLVAMGALAIGASASGGHKQAAEERILFVSDRDKPRQYVVYSMKPDGADQVRLSKGDGLEIEPAWSPDRKQIVFSRVLSQDNPTTNLCVMKADGSERAVILPEEPQTLHIAAAWSPDGKHIAYSAVKISDAFSSTIYVMDPDGKNRKKLVDGVVPVWSPDSKHLLFSSTPNSGVPDLKSVDMDGSNVKTFAVKGLGPAYSPDGKRIAFTGESDSIPTLFVMDTDGSHVTKVRQVADTICIGPVWTQDGKHLLYTQVPKDMGERPEVSIWVTNLDGTGAKSVTKADSMIGPGTAMLFVLRAARK